MAGFEYGTEAELFPSRNRKSRRQPFGYRRFEQAAHAIRFAIEELPSDRSWELISKSARRDMTAKEFVAYTITATIP